MRTWWLSVIAADSTGNGEGNGGGDDGAKDAAMGWLEKWMSDPPAAWLADEYLFVQAWQWIGLFIVILLGIALDTVVRSVLRTVARRSIERRGGAVDATSLRRSARPFGYLAGALTWLALIPSLAFGEAAMSVLLPAVRLIAVIAVAWAACRVTDLVGEIVKAKAARTETKLDDLLIPLVRKAMKIFIVAFGGIYAADVLSFELTPLLAALGIGGVGFAFAGKDTLENFFGSVTVIIDRPFQVGDWVVVEGVEGTVEEVGFRSTRIRTFYNSLITLPNSNLVRCKVDNYGRRKYRRWKTHIAITYDTPPDRIESFCEGIRELIRIHPYTRKDYYQVWMHQLGEHSLDVLVYLFHEAPDWQTELRERHRMILDIIRLADRLGVVFAFPTETRHLRSEDPPHVAAPPPEEDTEHRAELTGREAAGAITAVADWRDGKPPKYEFHFTAESGGGGGAGDGGE